MPDIQSIEGHLRDMPKGEKFRKLARMRELRTVMAFSVRDVQGLILHTSSAPVPRSHTSRCAAPG